jgi:predicted TIM-barrel fold metal-dependent hydrolase
LPQVIDVHNSFYPKIWIDYLQKRTKSPILKSNGSLPMTFYVDGVIEAHIERIGHYDPDARIKDMDEAGISTQMISMSVPSVELLDKRDGIVWAKRINDYYAEVCEKYRGRFYFNATLPYQDVEASLEELDRAYRKLGAKGILMFSNLKGKPISSPEFEAIFSKAAEYDLPIFVHPSSPLSREMMAIHHLPAALYGFTLDTSTAIMSLIWTGVFEKYPELKIVHSHLGGIVPYSIGRVDGCWNSYHHEYGLELKKLPSEYYKNQVWIDSISYFVPAMKCALEYMGADHICLGTDYAHKIGNLEKAIDWVHKFGASKKDTERILGGNAAKLYKLE